MLPLQLHLTECFDNDESMTCQATNGSIYLYRTCFNSTLASQFIQEYNNTIAGKAANLSDDEKIPAAQEYFKYVFLIYFAMVR